MKVMKKTQDTEKRIEELLKLMTLEEKVSLCHANSKFYVGGDNELKMKLINGKTITRSVI